MTTAPTGSNERALSEALAAHGLSWRRNHNGILWRCECRASGHVGVSFRDAEAAYNKHLAEALAPVVAEYVAAQVVDLREALEDEKWLRGCIEMTIANRDTNAQIRVGLLRGLLETTKPIGGGR